jgi:hypothetical protein
MIEPIYELVEQMGSSGDVYSRGARFEYVPVQRLPWFSSVPPIMPGWYLKLGHDRFFHTSAIH